MKNLFSFTLYSIAALVAISFLIIFVEYSQTINDEAGENNETPTEEPSDNAEQSGDNSDEKDNQDSDSSDEGNAGDSNSDEGNKDEESNNGENNNDGSSDNNEEDSSNEDANQEDSSQELYWGVDSANYTDENHYSCVVDNFGDPAVWGRYLGDKEGVSVGLDEKEISLLHENGISILVIYNHVNEAVGYDHGVEHANQAISMAEDLGIPEGVALLVDIEPSYPVDSAFMEGWYDTVNDSAYYPGVYGVFDEGSSLLEAYNAMNQDIQENTIVWTAFPQEEITTKNNAPEFNPQGPDNAMLYGWQYGLESQTCTIDTNLFTNDMMDYLWKE